MLAAIALGILAATGYLYLQSGKEETPRVEKSRVQTARPIVFDGFVIPVKEHNKFTYISLGISFKPANNKLAEEMTAKRNLLRGIIYDTLEKEINRTREVPSLDKMKAHIIRRADQALTSGGIEGAYVIDFLAV